MKSSWKHPVIPISDIRIDDQFTFRKDLGDISSLASSIKTHGRLLQPIGVSENNVLIWGLRRLRACEQLGWTEIPASVVDLDDPLKAQRDENVEHKPFTPSEAVSIGRAIEERERPKARERQREAIKERDEKGRAKPTSENFTEVDKSADDNRTAEKAASSVGMSRPTYEKAKAVVEAAEKNPEFSDLVERMDETGKIDGAFKEMKRRQNPDPPAKPDDEFDIEKAADKICDFLRIELAKWPRKHLPTILHFVNQIITKEFKP